LREWSPVQASGLRRARFPSLELILPETAGELNCPVHESGKHCAIALIGKTGSSIHFSHDKIR
jgi:hypothetical protein